MMKRFFVILVVLAVTSCATTGSVSDTKVSYSETARKNFEAGEAALAAGHKEEAVALFEYVRNKYPYTRYAADSDLGIADTHFSEEKWLEAASAYDFFTRFHPVHEKVAYAYFKQAQSNFNAMPTDFFLFPKAYTKDQTATKDALASLDKYLKQFPEDVNVKQAQEMRTKLRTQCALQSLHIAKFYEARKRWKGAVQRFDEIVKSFPETDTARQALLSLSDIEMNYLEKADKAKERLQQLVREYPGTIEATYAEAALQKLAQKS